MSRRRWMVVTGLLLITLMVSSPAYSAGEWNRFASVKLAKDVNPDPHIFETYLEAAPHQLTVAPGLNLTVFAYNGQVPGPEIRVNQGDRVIVHLTNSLPDGFPTTIHWHGIELNNRSDGTSATQEMVQPGESFTYDFIVPRGGLFWYHPHVRGAREVMAGLYGSLIVEQPEEASLVADGILPDDQLTVVLSDIAVTDREVRDVEAASVLETMNGSEGEYLLVNGVEKPMLNLPAGKAIRLQLINASITRYYRLALANHIIYRIGGEGGLLSNVRVEGGTLSGMRMPMSMEHMTDDQMSDGHMSMEGNAITQGPVEIDLGYDKGEILLAPAQRADVVIIPQGSPGDELAVMWHDFARGRHHMTMGPDGMMMTEADDDGQRPSVELLSLKLHNAGKADGFAIAEGDTLIVKPGSLTSDRQDTQIKLQANMMAMMSGQPKDTWFMIDDYAGIGGRANFRTATAGEIIEWEVHNHTDRHHPFHLHGFSFQPVRFVRMHHDAGFMDMWPVNAENEYVDTVDIPPHTSLYFHFKVTDRLAYGAEVNNGEGGGVAGDWVFHCHIFQHGENGMMSFLRVFDR